MVAAQNFVADKRVFQSRTQRFGDEKIIQSPADVSTARAAKNAPPGVMATAFFKLAERVQKTGVHKRGEAGALFRCETVVVDVGPRIRQIDFRVRHV